MKKIIYLFSVYLFVQTFLSLILISRQVPYGGGDAIAIWNLKAKLIFLENGKYWRSILSSIIFWTHPDYPFLLPGLIAFLWKLAGGSVFSVPQYLSIFITMSIVVVLFFAIKKKNGFLSAFFGELVLVSTPFFLTSGVSQYADVPISLFLLLSLIFFSKKKFLAAGIFSGLAAYVKNEGLIFSFAAVASLFIFFLFQKNLKKNIKNIFLFLYGCAPIIFSVVAFKFLSNSESSYVLQSLSGIIFKIFDYKRHLIIIERFAFGITSFGEWRINPLPFIGLLIFFSKKSLSQINLQLLIILFLYYFIYLITPYNLSWQLDTSFNRLLIQLWPSVIYLIFSYVSFSKRDK